MKGKYYTFTAGSAVPKWLFSADFDSMDRASYLHNKKHGKVIFRRSCVVIRGDMQTMSKVMPDRNSFGEHSMLITIKYYNHASFIGGVTCTGICTAAGPVSNLNAERV